MNPLTGRVTKFATLSEKRRRDVAHPPMPGRPGGAFSLTICENCIEGSANPAPRFPHVHVGLGAG